MLRRLLSIAAFAGATSIATVAPAQPVTGGYAVDKFEPSERGSDWFANESLDLRGSGRFAAGVVGNYASKPLVLVDPNGDERAAIVKAMVVANVGGSVNLFDRLRLGVNMPFELYGDGRTGSLRGVTYPSPPKEQAVGDLRLGLDVRVAGEAGGPATLAVGVQAWLPTGDRAQYLSDGTVRVRPRAMAAGDLGPIAWAFQAGVNIRDEKTVGVGRVGTELSLAAAAGVRFHDRRGVIGPELFTTTVFDDAFGKLTTPVEGIFGVHYWIAKVVRIGGGVGSGMTRGYGAPEARFLFGLEYAGDVKEKPVPIVVDHDKDKDGIPDDKDACPAEYGPASDDPGTTGCPDTDKDGIIDRDDACKTQPGPQNTDPQANGCPDKDGDAIVDSIDACPDVPGVKQTDPKKNGCPPDSDGDGVLDVDDACPDVPGVKTADPKTNGCPDTDKDGILDAVDACPEEPGDPDPDPKKNGCPKAFVRDGQIKILEQVKFKTGSAAIEAGKANEDLIAGIVKVMTEHPEITKVRVEGHTDNKGAPAMNKKLSADRAAAVVKRLTAAGIAASRLTSKGFGAEKPMASNATEEGRQENRRVELHIDQKSEK